LSSQIWIVSILKIINFGIKIDLSLLIMNIKAEIFFSNSKLRCCLLMVLVFLNSGLYVNATVFRTQLFDKTIKTLHIGRINEKYTSNLIELGTNDVLRVKFDQLSHEAHAYSYKILNCNADWTLSSLSTNEYIDGFTNADITDYYLSSATTFLYTHYRFDLPNNDMKFKISGNYVALIYEDNKTDMPVAQVCFSVYEPKVSFQHSIRANTDIELNGRYQQIDFDLMLNKLQVQNPQNEIKVLVRQNNRYDNEVFNVQPTFINGSKLSFTSNKALIFEGGNEFHSFDISSVYAASRGVDRIKYIQPHYEVFLNQDKINTSKVYNHEFDANGKFVINYQESTENSDINGDYMYVNFTLQAAEPFLDGQIFLGGDFNYNLFNENSKLVYDFKAGMYVYRALLKQGGYNYQYRFLQKGNSKSNVERVEGSFWQTTNEYSIFVYHRPVGGRYDKLIGVQIFDK